MLQFKHDWEKASERLEAWWDGEIIDRAVIQVTAPRDHLAAAAEWDIWSPPHNYKKILEHGKNLVLLVEPDDVEALIRELGPRGLLLQTTCDTEPEARLLLERVTGIGLG